MLDAPVIDTHCHLGFEAFAEDLDAVVARARAAGVAACVAVAVDLATAEQALALARRWPDWVRATAGIHPTEPTVADPAEWKKVTELLAGGSCVAVGETGLDAFHRTTTAEAQLASLHHHLGTALDLDLPVILHCRDAFPAMHSALRRYRGRNLRGVLHCFTGTDDDAAALLDAGLCLGLGGVTTYRANEALRGAVRNVPLESIVLETDAPWLAPVPMRGRRNEPAFVRHVATSLARDRDMCPEAYARATTATAQRLFALPSA